MAAAVVATSGAAVRIEAPLPPPSRPKLDRGLLNLAIDIAFWLAFLIAIEINATGLTFHEWWGVGIAAFIAVHVLLHWAWVAAAVQRFFHGLRAAPRLNAIVDAGLYLAFITAIFSGLVLSRAVLPALGLRGYNTPFWLDLHIQATNVSMALAVVHLALHWRWLLLAVRRTMSSAGGRLGAAWRRRAGSQPGNRAAS